MSNNPFWDQQQEFYKKWTENVSKIPGMKEYQDALKKMMPENMPNPMDYWKKMAESMPKPDEFMKKVKEAMPDPMEYWNKMAEFMPKPPFADPMEYWNKMAEFMPKPPFKDPMEYWNKMAEFMPKPPFGDPMEYWNKMAEFMPKPEDFTNPVEFWSKMAQSMPSPISMMEKLQSLPNPFEFWAKMADSIPSGTDYLEKLAELMTSSNPLAKMFGLELPGLDIYNKIIDFWKDMADPKNLPLYPQKFNDLTWEVFKGILPQSAKMFDKPHELLDTCISFYDKLFGPWMRIDEDIFKRIAAGDPHAYVEFFQTFEPRYEETFGKIFNMVGMGLNRESNEEQLQMINGSIKMLFSTGELIAVVLEACAKATQTMMDTYKADLAEGKQITTFKDFYDLWYKVTEDELVSLFDTEEFSIVFCKFADMSAQYMIAQNRVIERQLANLPIPTQKDMASLYKTVYELRKAVRDLTREVEALKAEKPSK